MKKRFNLSWRIVVALLMVFALAPVVALSGTVIAETTAPTLLSITWDDSGGTTAGVIDVGDDLIFHFSESMLTFTLDSMGEINARLDSTATGTADYGITGATLLWAGSGTWLTVTLGTEENIAGGETVNPTSTVKDKAGNADGTSSPIPAIPLPPDTTSPTLLSITWIDGGTTAGVIDMGDDLIFHFSESMDTTTVDDATELNARLDSSASGTADYGTSPTVAWNTPDTQCTVTLDTGEAIEGGETVNPASTVTDKAGNSDGTTGNGPAIPLPPDPTKPTLLSIGWTDIDTSTTITAGDRLVFKFSESMDTTTVTNTTINADLLLSGTGATYGTTPGITWDIAKTLLTVTLGTGTDIVGGETVNPAVTVLDKAGNADNTSAPGPAIPTTPTAVSAETTCPTLLSITWDDSGGTTAGIIDGGDKLVFHFSEAMKTTTVDATNVNTRLDSSASTTADYGSTGLAVVWNTPGTQCTVTLGTDEQISGGETVNPISAVEDMAGNDDTTSSPIPAIPLPPDATSPTLRSITWIDNNTNGIIDVSDKLVFHFSESMDTTTVTNTTIDADLELSGTGDTYGTTPSLVWNTDNTSLTVTLGAGVNIKGGETVNPAATVTDKAGNSDATATPAIPLPPDPTAPILVSIVWDDVDSSGIIDGGDKLVFHFSEAMDSTTVDDAAELNARLDSTASGAADYGTTPTMTWDTPTYTQLTVFLDSDDNIGGGETVNPTSDVTDMAGNADGTTGAGTEIPTTPGVADTTNPVTASVTMPTAGDSYNAASMPITFRGIAADNSGGVGLNADSTTFTLRNLALDYWTGSAWGALTYLATTHAATTSNTQVTWIDAVTLPAWTDGSTYTVQAKAIDKNSNTFTGTAVTFTYDNTSPTLNSITWTDVDASDTIDAGDTLRFNFSEAMDTTTLNSVSEINSRLDSTATGTADYGTTFTFSWNTAKTQLTVTLGAGEDISGGETVNPASTVTDEAGNPDATTAPGPAIPTPTVDTTSPTLNSITWTDVDDSDTINAVDTLRFNFSEAMDTTTIDSVSEINSRLDSTATGTADYGTTFTFSWNTAKTQLTVTLGTAEAISGGETVNPASTVKDEAGNADATTAPGPAIPTPTPPTLTGITWTDVDDSNTINEGDTLRFTFSEAMDTTTLDSVSEINSRLDSTATGTADYGTTFTFSWNTEETQLTVTLGSGETIVGGETVDPSDSVTDVAGNPDNTTAPPAIEVPEEEGLAWEWWYTLLIALGALIIIAAVVLLVVLPKRGAGEEFAEEELYEEEEEF